MSRKFDANELLNKLMALEKGGEIESMYISAKSVPDTKSICTTDDLYELAHDMKLLIEIGRNIARIHPTYSIGPILKKMGYINEIY